MPRLQGITAEARGGLRIRGGTRHRRRLRSAHRRASALAGAARSPPHGGRDRGHDPEGALGEDRIPGRCWPRLPDARPPDAHPVGRRGPAHLAGQLPGLASGRHALRSRRAVDRAAPPGHGRPAGPAEAVARRGQHGRRGGARRGRDHGRRPCRGARPGFGRGGRGGRVRGSAGRLDGFGDKYGAVSVQESVAGDEKRGLAPEVAPSGGRGAHPARGRDAAQPSRRRGGVSGGSDDGGDGRLRLGQVDAGPRYPLSGAGARAAGRPHLGQGTPGGGGGRVQRAHRTRAPGRRGAGRPEADREDPPLQPRHLRQGVGRDPPHLRERARRPDRGPRRAQLLLQREGRALRGMCGRGLRAGRDGLHGRHPRALRSLRGESATAPRCSKSRCAATA